MINHNVISILKTFSVREIRLFGEFINTFHNKNTKVIKLFDLLKKYSPDYSVRELTKENLFKKLTGNSKYKESYIRNLFSDMNILLEKFLQYNLILNNNISSEKIFIEDLMNRDLYELAEKKITLFEKKISHVKVRDHNYFSNRNFVYEIKSFLTVDKTLTDNFRNDQILNTIKLFMIILMENSFYLMVEEQRVKIRHDYSFLKHSIEYIKDHYTVFEDSPLLIIYYNLWMCFLCEDDKKYFLTAKEHFRKHFNSLTKIDKKNLYSVMQIYYINKLDRGNKSYREEFLNFLIEMLNFKVLSHKEQDHINLNLYRNILILCTMLKATGILKKFISKYISYIKAESRSSVLAYSNSQLLFLQGNYGKALELCNSINFNDLLMTTNENLFFKNDIKQLALKCFYELNSFESAISHIDAFKHYLKNSRLIKENVRKKFMNFLNSVNKLIKLKMSFDEFEFLKLKKKILNTNELMQSDWLLEKVNEMENKFLR